MEPTMLPIDEIAHELNVTSNELQQRSIVSYVEHLLFKAESEILAITAKYGVNTVEELDQLLHAGKTSERACYDDYFALDNLAAERRKVARLVRTEV
jgi:hypothetical protein